MTATVMAPPVPSAPPDWDAWVDEGRRLIHDLDRNRCYHPVLIDAGFADLNVPIPWWDNRKLRFRFPPR